MTEKIIEIEGISFVILRQSEKEFQELNESKNNGRVSSPTIRLFKS